MCPAPIDAETPRGFIIPIGGGEDRVKEMQIHRKFVELSGGSDADIVVIPTASMLEETGPDYNRIFSELGAGKVEFLPISRRADCDNPEYVEMLDRATGVFMTGGNQLRLSAILGGTLVAQKIRRRNAAGVPVAGTSAGASIMSEHMVAGGSSNSAPAEGNITLAPGMGLTNAVIIDQHFTQRNRLGRLLTASSFNPFLIGLGIDEDTAAFIGPDNVFEVIGSGSVTVVDASQLTHSSMWDARRGEALSLLGLRLDVLGEGCRYDLTARQAFPPDEHLAFCTLPDFSGEEAANGGNKS
ncbi:cyanophycinase [Ruegeria sp. HKCCD6228]|uniref:Cyanophycinase n=1 Tax=Ruegeria atlantica TaxID=81569 RepID=A0AA90YYF6_9RHOB|nr:MULTISPECIES: cyanophycinase [Ruegeria]NOC92535.1 cyanophycinase [Ruegeria sp. HKCCD6604]NOD97675.1 cyanophycinase [Ruegeria sp. HKCCD6228]NOE20030.1 cyanophycinase [Ruegeria atlantica]